MNAKTIKTTYKYDVTTYKYLLGCITLCGKYVNKSMVFVGSKVY